MGKPEWRAMTAYNKHAESISWQRANQDQGWQIQSVCRENTHAHTHISNRTRKHRVYYRQHQFGNPVNVNIQINMATLEAS